VTRTQSYLNGLHTKQLLQLRDRIQASGDTLYHVEEAGLDVTKEEVKHVLATREHVPNKQEARLIRQEKAKGGRAK